MRVSMINPPLRFDPERRVAAVVERVAVFEPGAGEHRSAHEVREPAQLPKVSSGRDVVVIASKFAHIVGAEMERQAQLELIGGKPLAAKGRAPAGEHEHAVGFAQRAEDVHLTRQLLEAVAGALAWAAAG